MPINLNYEYDHTDIDSILSAKTRKNEGCQYILIGQNGEPEFNFGGSLYYVALIPAVVQRAPANDVFNELFPLISTPGNTNAKILFAFNDQYKNWITIAIDIRKAVLLPLPPLPQLRSVYTVVITAFDPFENNQDDNLASLQTAIKENITSRMNEMHLPFIYNNGPGPHYFRNSNLPRIDSLSSAPVAIEYIYKIINAQALPTVNDPSNIQTIREDHVSLIESKLTEISGQIRFIHNAKGLLREAKYGPLSNEKEIIQEFNRDRIKYDSWLIKRRLRHPRTLASPPNKSFLTESYFFGKRIKPSQYRLVQRNNIPELISYSPKRQHFRIFLTGTDKDLGVYEKTDLLIGALGHYIVNVKSGTYVKAWEGTEALILLPGTHIIHHSNFRLAEDPVVRQDTPYISHGDLYILNVPLGKVAKVWINNRPEIWEGREKPYTDRNPTFHTEETNREELFTDASREAIQHGSSLRLIIKPGMAAITYDSQGQRIIEWTPITNPAFEMNKPLSFTNRFFEGFLPEYSQTLEIPSEDTKAKRRSERIKEEDFINYEVFEMSDKKKTGIIALIIYTLSAERAMKTFGSIDKIKQNIENFIVANLGTIFQTCEEGEINKILTKAQAPAKNSPKAFNFFFHSGKGAELARRLSDSGITLDEIKFNDIKVLNSPKRTYSLNDSGSTSTKMTQFNPCKLFSVLRQ